MKTPQEIALNIENRLAIGKGCVAVVPHGLVLDAQAAERVSAKPPTFTEAHMANRKKTKTNEPKAAPAVTAGNGVRNVNLEFAGEELAALEKEATGLGMKFASLVRGIVRKRYKLATPVPSEPAS